MSRIILFGVEQQIGDILGCETFCKGVFDELPEGGQLVLGKGRLSELD